MAQFPSNPPQQMMEPSNQTMYTIAVKTSDLFGASTEANAFVLLIGELGTSPTFQLMNSINHRNKFQRNHSDVFVFPQVQSLGEIKQVQIWHDNTGPSPAWHLDAVEVHDSATNTIFTFLCQHWLDKTEEDCKLSRLLTSTGKRNHLPKNLRNSTNGRSVQENQPPQQRRLQPAPPTGAPPSPPPQFMFPGAPYRFPPYGIPPLMGPFNYPPSSPMLHPPMQMQPVPNNKASSVQPAV